MRTELPCGWTSERLREIVVSRKGKKPTTVYKQGAADRVPYILIDEMEGKPIRNYTDDAKVPLASKEDVLIVWDGSIGKCARGLEGAIGSTIVALTPIGIDSNYLESFIKFSRPLLLQTSRGTGLQHINQEIFWDLRVPVAPIEEQHRIVAKLEILLAKVEACQKRLNEIPTLLKRFRQSVLSAACSGRLTADWREKNECSVAADYSQDALYDFPPLPETWSWQPLATVCEKVVDCPHSTPKWTNSGRLCVRTTNFKPGFLDLTEVRYVSDETFMERIVRVKPQPGDILYSREGGILGIACMIPTGVELCLGQRMMLFRPNQKFTGVLLMYWLNSPATLHRIQELIGGSASPHLNVKDIKNFLTPVPPLAEQQEIARCVEALFKISEQIEERYQKAKAYIDKLTQSILAKAFRGELVPQDLNDEPAAELLKMIKK